MIAHRLVRVTVSKDEQRPFLDTLKGSEKGDDGVESYILESNEDTCEKRKRLDALD